MDVFEREKFKRLVHYVIWRAGDKPRFGATKLNKVLWFAEARQYALTGRPIANASYVREKFGPVPRGIMTIRKELEDEGKIRIYPAKNAYEGWRFRSLSAPEQSGFSAQEIATVDWWIRHIGDDHTAQSISDDSHDYAWDIAKMGEALPFYAFFAERMREPNEEELEWAREAARKAGRL